MLRQLDKRNPQPVRPTTFKPYQLKPKRGKETFIEPPVEQPPSNQKQIKCMKKKLGKLSKKIKHSKKKHNKLVSKRNSIKEKIEELKRPRKPEELHEPEETFNPIELEQVFNGAYRNYRINGRSRMDVDTFFDQIRQNLIDLINKELAQLGSARVQMTTWIRYVQEHMNDEIDIVNRAFNSRMIEVHRGDDLDEIVDGMTAHMKTQIENPALLRSEFRFDELVHLILIFIS